MVVEYVIKDAITKKPTSKILSSNDTEPRQAFKKNNKAAPSSTHRGLSPPLRGFSHNNGQVSSLMPTPDLDFQEVNRLYSHDSTLETQRMQDE